MNIRNMKSGRIKVIVATTLTLLLSVAQSAGASGSLYGMDSWRLIDSSFDQEPSSRLNDIDEQGYLDGSNARLVLSRADEFGEISVIEMHRNGSTRTHFNFKSSVADEVLSATLVVSGETYSLTFDLPSGQILVENDMVSIITASDFSQVILAESAMPNSANEYFTLMLHEVLQGSDMLGFNMFMAESLAESNLLSLTPPQEPYAKGGKQYAEGGWGCGGALIALAAANAALAAAIAVTYATAGMAAVAIAAAVSAVGAAITAVDMYCLQM